MITHHGAREDTVGDKEVWEMVTSMVEGLKQRDKMLSATDRGHEGMTHSAAQAGEEDFLSC